VNAAATPDKNALLFVANVFLPRPERARAIRFLDRLTTALAASRNKKRAPALFAIVANKIKEARLVRQCRLKRFIYENYFSYFICLIIGEGLCYELISELI
jgi:hypothetical protein